MLANCVEDKNPINNLGGTPFHLAAISNQLSICVLMMKDVEVKYQEDYYGITPFQYAAMYDHLDICEMIASFVDLDTEEENKDILFRLT